MYKDIIEQADLTPREAEIYEIILGLGESPVNDVIHKTGDHPQVVYRIIDSLAAKNLVNISIRKNKRYVEAESPKALEERIQSKLHQLRSIMPSLLAMEKNPEGAVVKVHKGEEAVKNIRSRIINELPVGGEYSIITAADEKYYEIMGKFHQELDRKRIKKKIRRLMLSFDTQRKMLKEFDWASKLTDYRFLPQSYSSPVSTTVFLDTVIIYILADDPIVITIENKEAAESFKIYFTALWKIAKE